MACPSDEYCFTSICSLVAETGSTSSSSSFCFEGSCLRKQNGGWLLLSSEATLPRCLLRRRGGGGCFVTFWFHFASSLVCVSFCLWSLSFITFLHDSQTTYTPSTGHKHVKQYRRTTLASKRNNQKKCDLSSRRVRTQRPWFSGGGTFPRPCERGRLRRTIRHTCRHPKTDLFENGSFWKRIRVHVASIKWAKVYGGSCFTKFPKRSGQKPFKWLDLEARFLYRRGR